MNFIWEISQAGLYEPHFQGFFSFISVHLRATFGDVAILLFIYLIISLVFGDWKWIKREKAISYVIVFLIGFILAIIIEKYALLTGRWAYNESMPIIPYFNVGLTPVLQLAIIAPFSVFLAKIIVNSNK